jgi:hypothetical protein
MNPRLKHPESVVLKTRATQKIIRVAGGIAGAPVVRVDCGRFTLIGPMFNLQVEDPVEQAPTQAQSKQVS